MNRAVSLRGLSGLLIILIIGTTCLRPARAEVGDRGPSLAISSVLDADGVPPGGRLRAAVKATLFPGWHVNAHRPREDFLVPLELELTPPEGISVRKIVYPEAELVSFAFSPEPMAVYEGDFTVGVELEVAQSVEAGKYTVTGNLRYQACNDASCWAPSGVAVKIPVPVLFTGEGIAPRNRDLFAGIEFEEAGEPSRDPDSPPPAVSARPEEDNWRRPAEDFTIAGRAVGYKGAREFLSFLARPGAGGPFQGKSRWAIVFLTLLGGLVLNLTPCVLPLIPVNLAVIGAGAASGSRLRGLVLGGIYGLGITIVYGILGLLAAFTGSTFGAINASPWFNLVIAVIFLFLALAMFDVFLIDFSRFGSGIGPKNRKGGLAAAFLIGALAAVLAGACVAPVVIAVILFAQNLYAQGSYLGLALPFILGAGMALPWPLAGAGLSLLPRPGKWMVKVKYALGILIALLAAYYGYQAGRLFFVGRGGAGKVQIGAGQIDEEGWTNSLGWGLSRARAEGKPVLIDFWATWCKSCLTMNRTTFRDRRVVQRLEGFIKIKYQAEDPSDPEVKAVLDYFGVRGLPTYVILEPGKGADQ